MIDKLWFLIPEMVMFAGAVVVSVLGLSRSKRVRDLSPAIVIVSLVIAAALTPLLYANEARLANAALLIPSLGLYVKVIVPLVGILLAFLTIGLVDRALEVSFSTGRASFDAIRVTRGEFYAFFLLSLIGVMLIANANDLIWLFLALELVSLPTYVMVATARAQRRALEAAVKYFFLGALSAAMFLFGFALIYGATGEIVLTDIAEAFAAQKSMGDISTFGVIGMILATLGISFKIAAVPMHFYAADVYEGAASPVTAFLGFVPKAAGMLALILLLSAVGWGGAGPMPREIIATLWMIAVLTMTVGNVLALLQRSAKRVLAYSSIAHSGYMLIGLVAGPEHGLPAVLFYLLMYGIMNTAAFAVLAALERKGTEIDSLDDLVGLRKNHPALAAVMAIACISLIGFPPVIGFVGKLFLFRAGVDAGQVSLIVIAAINSAISAWYYLKLAGLPILARPTAQSEEVVRVPSRWPRVGAIVSAIAICTLWIIPGPIYSASQNAVHNNTGLEDDASAENNDERVIAESH